MTDRTSVTNRVATVVCFVVEFSYYYHRVWSVSVSSQKTVSTSNLTTMVCPNRVPPSGTQLSPTRRGPPGPCGGCGGVCVVGLVEETFGEDEDEEVVS